MDRGFGGWGRRRTSNTCANGTPHWDCEAQGQQGQTPRDTSTSVSRLGGTHTDVCAAWPGKANTRMLRDRKARAIREGVVQNRDVLRSPGRLAGLEYWVSG